MKKIESYMLFFTPQGNGQVVFRLEGEGVNKSTPPLSPVDFAALVGLLAQKNLAFDPVKKMFASSDENDVLNPGSHLNA